jgi:hypothetical protein
VTAETRRVAWQRATAFEAGVWRSLTGWILRRPVAGPGETAHSYFGAMRTNYLIFIGISAIEIPALHFLIPWPTARFVLVLVGVWGLIWCLGLLASMTRHPHLTTADGLRLRYGATVDVPLPWDTIDVATLRQDLSSEGRVVQVVGGPDSRTLQLAISNQTNLMVRLREPLEIRLPAGRFTVTAATFYADDPEGLLAAVRGALR